jgi:hypothetical protein
VGNFDRNEKKNWLNMKKKTFPKSVINVYFRPLDQHFSSSVTSIQCKDSDK